MKNPRGRQKTRREKQEEKGRKKDEKRDTQKRCLKRKREKSFKNAKNKNENIFSKREKTFVHTKRFQLKIKAEKNISCFFKKKEKRLIKRTFFF